MTGNVRLCKFQITNFFITTDGLPYRICRETRAFGVLFYPIPGKLLFLLYIISNLYDKPGNLALFVRALVYHKRLTVNEQYDIWDILERGNGLLGHFYTSPIRAYINHTDLTSVDSTRKSLKYRNKNLTMLTMGRVEEYQREARDAMTHNITLNTPLDIEIFTGEKK